MNNYINFEIAQISAGWFDVWFKTVDKNKWVTASDAWENDSPRAFLKMLCNMLEENNCEKYVIWDEEPGVYIIFIGKRDGKYNMKITYSKICHHELFADIRNVSGDKTYEEMCERMDDLEIRFACDNFYYIYFLRTVLRAFEEYEKKEERLREYRDNWMDFSHKELEELRQRLK